VPAGKGLKVEESIYVNRSPEDLYQFWKRLENLPRFMRHVHAVRIDGNRSHWVVKGPLGLHLEWDAAIINDHPNELIAWRSLPGSTVDNAGSVHFQSTVGDWGTKVSISLKYDPPAGRMGAALAHMLGQDPEADIREDLRRFKHLMEAGEAPATHGQPSGRIDWTGR
jgi:uncharacterized membrane protein